LNNQKTENGASAHNSSAANCYKPKCFECGNEAEFILKHFWLGMSYLPAVKACKECKERITKFTKRIEIEPIK